MAVLLFVASCNVHAGVVKRRVRSEEGDLGDDERRVCGRTLAVRLAENTHVRALTAPQ